MPVDGAVALILTRADRVGDLRSKPVRIHSLGHATGPTLDTEYVARHDRTWRRAAPPRRCGPAPTSGPATSTWPSSTTASPAMAICWLEDIGFVKKGEAGPFLAEGRGRLGGELPICTDGGHLGAGRLHGLGKLAEAVQQLRGECGRRQVPGAEVAVACAGGGSFAAAILLTA